MSLASDLDILIAQRTKHTAVLEDHLNAEADLLLRDVVNQSGNERARERYRQAIGHSSVDTLNSGIKSRLTANAITLAGIPADEVPEGPLRTLRDALAPFVESAEAGL